MSGGGGKEGGRDIKREREKRKYENSHTHTLVTGNSPGKTSVDWERGVVVSETTSDDCARYR